MNLSHCTNLIPSLLSNLKSKAGLLTAITDLRRGRFHRYLRRPARLLRDGWSVAAAENSREAVYTLEGLDGSCQQLRLSRAAEQAVLTTSLPNQGQEQTIVYCLRQKRVVANRVKTHYRGVERQQDWVQMPTGEKWLQDRYEEAQQAS